MSITNIKENINLYLKLLGYTESDRVFFRGLSDGKNAKSADYLPGKINYQTLQNWNDQGFGVYMVVNGGGKADENVKHGRAIFYEHDNLPKDEQKQLWQKLNLPEPTFQVDTGGKSIHSYWVFDKPSPVEDWKTLQADLLEFSDGDRSIKNPSRVMRVPGFKHQETGVASDIVSSSGNKYSYQELRELVPARKPPTLPPLGDGRYNPNDTSSAKYVYEEINQLNQMPPPLTIFLTKDDRDLIERGVSQGGRNTAGAKLARNLIGTALRLNYLGITYTDTSEALFNDYCSHYTSPIDSKEAAQIWKSAEKSNPTATLTDDALENCIKAWQRQNRQPKKSTISTLSSPSTTSNIVDFLSQQWNVSQVEQQLRSLAQIRPKTVKLNRELKKLSHKSGWKDVKYLKDFYQAILEEQDREAELEDDIVEFNEILNSNEPLPCDKILPKKLHPILKLAQNLGVNSEPVLLALETTVASFIHPETRIVGRRCSDYEEVPIIFSVIVGDPGAKKTPITNAIASKPLAKMEKEATEQYNAELKEYERALAEWEGADKQDKGDKPTPPKRRQYITGDYTPEALREVAQDNPKILRLFDELAREANSRGRYTNGKGGDAQQLLESYNGYLPPMNRKGKHYPGCLTNQSLLGGIQPDVLSKIMSSADPTGEFARYNVATLLKKPHYWNGDSEASLDITPLLVGLYKVIDELPALKFYLTPSAYALFEKYHNNAEIKANEETKPALIYQYSKADGKILRWALLYHILEAVANNQIPSETIGKRPMQIAAYRMRYQINQVRAILALMEDTEPSKLSQIYQLALRKNRPITPRDVRRGGYVKTANQAIELFRRLEDMGYGQVVKTSQTYKFLANTERKVAEGGKRWHQSTATSSNKVEVSSLVTQNEKGGTKVAVSSKADTVTDTSERWQGGTTSFSDSDNQASESDSLNEKVAVGGGKMALDSATSSNKVESSSSPTPKQKGDTKAKVILNPDTATDTSKRRQCGTTPSSESFEDLSQLKPGDKACYKSCQFVVKENRVNEKVLFSNDGGKFLYKECHLPNFPSFKLGEKILYNGKNATYCGKASNNWQILIMVQGYMTKTEVNIDQCTQLK